MSLLADTNDIPSTGVADSVKVSIADIRIVDTKLLDLELANKEIDYLKIVNSNQKIIIDSLKIKVSMTAKTISDYKIKFDKEHERKNIYKTFAVGEGAFLLICILLL